MRSDSTDSSKFIMNPSLQSKKPKIEYDRLNIPEGRNFRIDTVEKILSMSHTFVWRLLDEGILYGFRNHGSKIAIEALDGPQEGNFRYSRRIARESVITYLVKTADFTDDQKFKLMQDALNTCSADLLMQIRDYCLLRVKEAGR